MALYSMAFSAAHVFSAKVGMDIIDRFGFETNWYLMGALGFLSVVLMIWLSQAIKAENMLPEN